MLSCSKRKDIVVWPYDIAGRNDRMLEALGGNTTYLIACHIVKALLSKSDWNTTGLFGG